MNFDTGTTPLFTALGQGIVAALQPLVFRRENPSERGSYLRTLRQIDRMPTAQEHFERFTLTQSLRRQQAAPSPAWAR